MRKFAGLKNLVIGCGLFGSVVAERIATVCGERVLLIDKRNHVGGNAYSETNSTTGVEYHKYGSHIFHTNKSKVWDYITEFTKFNTYQHKVLTEHNGHMYTMPINLMTINSFYGLNLKPHEAAQFLRDEIEKAAIKNPSNLEEKAISLIGGKLYHAFIKGYTEKQWNCDPRKLPEDIITRLPVRISYDINYFNDTWQGIPLGGYAKLFERMLHHKNIDIMLSTDFASIKDQIPDDCKIVFTGMLDQMFDYKFGPLDWRSLDFEWEELKIKDYQGTSVINFPDCDVRFTRVHEFKHYHPERSDVFESNMSLICRESPRTYRPGMEAFYPVNTAENQKKYTLYVQEAASNPNLIIGGRLGAYEYWDMDKTIENALLCFESKFQHKGA